MFDEIMKSRKQHVRRELDIDMLDKLCAMHCTRGEIAAFFDISVDTLVNKIRQLSRSDGTPYVNFIDYYEDHCNLGKISLRKMQWMSAQRGNVPMQIFLGKNMLEQTEKTQVDMAGITEIKVDFVDPKEEPVKSEDE